MPTIDKRLLDMTDPVTVENFNRTLIAAGSAIAAVTLTADADGKITGGTVSLTDKTSIPITVETAAT